MSSLLPHVEGYLEALSCGCLALTKVTTVRLHPSMQETYTDVETLRVLLTFGSLSMHHRMEYPFRPTEPLSVFSVVSSLAAQGVGPDGDIPMASIRPYSSFES